MPLTHILSGEWKKASFLSKYCRALPHRTCLHRLVHTSTREPIRGMAYCDWPSLGFVLTPKVFFSTPRVEDKFPAVSRGNRD